jgi:hypothetical protein
LIRLKKYLAQYPDLLYLWYGDKIKILEYLGSQEQILTAKGPDFAYRVELYGEVGIIHRDITGTKCISPVNQRFWKAYA